MCASHQPPRSVEVPHKWGRGGGLSAWQGVNRDVGELRTNSQRLSDKAVLSLFSVADMTPILWVWEKKDSETGN